MDRTAMVAALGQEVGTVLRAALAEQGETRCSGDLQTIEGQLQPLLRLVGGALLAGLARLRLADLAGTVPVCPTCSSALRLVDQRVRVLRGKVGALSVRRPYYHGASCRQGLAPLDEAWGLGGVPRRVVIDNLKAGIIQAAWDEPQVQATYRECAEHYGFLIAPCRPRTPEHKGKVEQGGVHYVCRNFLGGRDARPARAAGRSGPGTAIVGPRSPCGSGAGGKSAARRWCGPSARGRGPCGRYEPGWSRGSCSGATGAAGRPRPHRAHCACCLTASGRARASICMPAQTLSQQTTVSGGCQAAMWWTQAIKRDEHPLMLVSPAHVIGRRALVTLDRLQVDAHETPAHTNATAWPFNATGRAWTEYQFFCDFLPSG
jgi:hypothetical protein